MVGGCLQLSFLGGQEAQKRSIGAEPGASLEQQGADGSRKLPGRPQAPSRLIPTLTGPGPTPFDQGSRNNGQGQRAQGKEKVHGSKHSLGLCV